ncbi:MAG: 50S ribosomal protein L4 [bacterium]|nr:50S ribosomal protein L4 [bacterium]MDD5354635.1 50S ribosomal protein L4 [bacterium]MDD5756470.1 50S ribosomal protein L4 [bacterium]
MSEVDILNFKGEKTGKIALSAKLFDQKINATILHEVITMQLANKRLGTASTKTRGEVSGGGIKPYKQKHTGRARAGSTRSPLWRHGGIIFGPRPRSYKYDVPAKKKQAALISALSSKAKDNGIIVLDKLELAQPKTKNIGQMLKKLNINGLALLVVVTVTNDLARAARNIQSLELATAAKLNVYEILQSKHLIITKEALAVLEARVKEK